MNNQNNFVVIMAGGVGTRLWPFSRSNYPKQFHDILGNNRSLLQLTVDRFKNVCPNENIFIVSNKLYKNLIQQQLPDIPTENILLEPVKRNTAPCVAYATYKIALKNPNANMVVAPADHIIRQENAFTATVLKALSETADKDELLTLGIKPSRPDTGYGYIQFIEDGSREIKKVKTFIEDSSQEIKKVKTFTEKPELELAVKFLESGDFLWNAGIFVWNVKAIIKAFEKHLSELAEIFSEAQEHFYTPEEDKAIKKAYSLCKSVSLDYGIMEKAENVFVIPSDFDWSDLGTWKSLYELSEKDANKNVISGEAIVYDSKGCIIKTPKNKLVVIQGLENFIIAEFEDVLLICRKDDEQKVRDFVADAKNKSSHFV